MKKKVFVSFICFIAMASLPFISTLGQETKKQEGKALNDNSVIEKNESKQEQSKDTEEKTDCFKILDEDTQEIITVDDRTFCYGAVAAEMIPSFEKEALKAQCVASYTHFCGLRKKQRENPDSSLKGADFSANLSNNQYYISNEKMKKEWGNLYKTSYENIKSAVDDVFGEVMVDNNNEFITVAYHAISGGTTETFSDIFGKNIEYLQAVASPGDLIAPGYMSKCSVSKQEFKNKISDKNNKTDFSKSADKWIKDIKRTNSGTVTNINIGGIDFTGSEIREIFGLRSANFEIVFSDDSFDFTVYGYGHGVGMSQYGAEYMAQQGADYKEILNWYYQGVKFTVYNS